jgi:membrane associated rhomboid family serine protease
MGSFHFRLTEGARRVLFVAAACALALLLLDWAAPAFVPGFSPDLGAALALRPGEPLWPLRLLSAPFATTPPAWPSLALHAVLLGFFVGPVEAELGRRGLWKLFAVCALGAGLGAWALSGLAAGAYAGILPFVLAVVLISCSLTPDAIVHVFFVVGIPIKWIGAGAAALIVARALGLFAPMGGGSGGGYELGGAALGFLWFRHRDDLDPRRFARRRKARKMLREVERTVASVDGPVWH